MGACKKFNSLLKSKCTRRYYISINILYFNDDSLVITTSHRYLQYIDFNSLYYYGTCYILTRLLNMTKIKMVKNMDIRSENVWKN